MSCVLWVTMRSKIFRASPSPSAMRDPSVARQRWLRREKGTDIAALVAFTPQSQQPGLTIDCGSGRMPSISMRGAVTISIRPQVGIAVLPRVKCAPDGGGFLRACVHIFAVPVERPHTFPARAYPLATPHTSRRNAQSPYPDRNTVSLRAPYPARMPPLLTIEHLLPTNRRQHAGTPCTQRVVRSGLNSIFKIPPRATAKFSFDLFVVYVVVYRRPSGPLASSIPVRQDKPRVSGTGCE